MYIVFRICDFGSEISENLVHHTLSICLGIQFRQCSVIFLKKDGEKKEYIFWILLALHDPETKAF